ncbi:MAG TPA: CheR family methyltransferase [Vicinamibacterales bacterium]
MAFTFFFRDQHVLDLIVKHVGPTLCGRSRARIWDAGCAMGPEPYSLAILMAESLGYFAFNNLRIDASDLDDCGLFGPIIESGTYDWQEIERLPKPLLEKYFSEVAPKRYQIVQRVRNCVRFQRHDLLSLKPIGEGYHLILCKNVLLHLQPAERVEVIRMFHASLAPGGFMATEQTQKMPGELEPLFEQVVSDGQVFRKVEAAQASAA